MNDDGSYSRAAANVGDTSFHVKKAIDPRLDYEDLATVDKEYIGYVGAMNWNSYSKVATDWDDTEVKWTLLTTNGPGSMIDKKWFVDYEVKVTISNMPVVSTELRAMCNAESCIAFRPFPFNYVSESISLHLNDRTMTNNNHISLYPRMEYWPQPALKLSNGCCPHRKPNGQTFADMELRKNNSPFCTLAEYNDQDYPNTTLPTILSVNYIPGTVARGSDFERGGIPRSIRVSNIFEYTTDTDEHKWVTQPKGSTGAQDADDHAGVEDWGKAQISFNAAVAYYIYQQALLEYANLIKTEHRGAVTMEEMMQVKRLAAEKAKVEVLDVTNNKVWESATAALDKSNLKDIENGKEIINTFIDLDLLPEEYEQFLIKSYRAFYFEKGQKSATVFWFQSCALTTSTYELVARIREPLICEPLDFTSSAEFGRTMWNLNNFEVKVNLSKNLNEMIMIDDYRLMAMSDAYWLFNHHLKYVKGQSNIELIDDAHINVHLNSAPRLVYNIATPFVPPKIPYVCQHKQFKRYESHDTDQLKVSQADLVKYYMNPATGNQRPIKTRSENLSLSFHPNSIFIWVAQRQSDRAKAPHKFTRADSYAKITKLNITYGNSANLMAQFDEHELFQMSLRNGLQDRSFLDWNATMKSITAPTDFYGNGTNLGWTGRRYMDVSYDGTTFHKEQSEPMMNPAYNRYAGVGSVVRIIPGIDLLNGNGTNPLIAGMRSPSTSIQIEVEFVPLNAYEATDYALNVMFEYDGVCTLQPTTCDLGMIAIESFEQLRGAPKARTMRESYAYGAGLGDNIRNALRFGQRLMKNMGVATRSRSGSGYINSVGNLGRSVKMSGGKLISQSDLFRRY